jgi:hypothetical protein
MKSNDISAFLVGVIVGGALVHFVTTSLHDDHSHHLNMDGTHPIGYADSEDEVHVHSDFLLYFDNQEYDFTKDEYQTTNTQELHDSIHLHDNVGNVIHRHADDVTLSEFFGSLGFTLTNDCITTSAGEKFCTDDTNELMVFVNDERIENPADYVNQEEDQILIYHGNRNDNETIRELLLSITDEACIYSGTCPERGVAPPESCGLTCEL